MSSQQHVYNGLARSADESVVFAQDRQLDMVKHLA